VSQVVIETYKENLKKIKNNSSNRNKTGKHNQHIEEMGQETEENSDS